MQTAIPRLSKVCLYGCLFRWKLLLDVCFIGPLASIAKPQNSIVTHSMLQPGFANVALLQPALSSI